jgi:hypothetical protein
MSRLEKRRCDLCGEIVESDEFQSLPAHEGWAALTVKRGANQYYDLCPPCIQRVADYLTNRRSLFIPVEAETQEPAKPAEKGNP